MRSIHLYKADDQTIITIEGAGPELDQLIAGLVQQALGISVPMESINLQKVSPNNRLTPPDVSGLKEMEGEKMEPWTISEGEYKGMTPSAALYQGKEKALVELFQAAKSMPAGENKEQLRRACKQYMAQEIPNEEELTTEEEITEYIRTVYPMMNEKAILQGLGYQKITEFLEFAAMEEKRLAYQAIRLSLIERGQRQEQLNL